MPKTSPLTRPLPPAVLPVTVVVGVMVIAIVALSTILRPADEPLPPVEEEESAGAVLQAQTSIAPTPPPDYDHDGKHDGIDPDWDNDGWDNRNDPVKSGVYLAGKWYPNIDNDANAGPQDPDEDNDGIADTKDRYPNDQNNNGKPDPVERRERGQRYDGDGDGRADIRELIEVARVEMKELGISIVHPVRNLADIPPEVFRQLPSGWNYVCQDRDNDGNPDATDRFDYSRGGSYAAYTHDGSFESNFKQYAEEWKKHGFVSTGVAGILDEPPRYEVPSGWPPPGYTPSGGYAGGTPVGDHYAGFYGHVPTSERHLYVPPGETVTTGPGGTVIYHPPAAGFAPPATYPEGSTGVPHTDYTAPVAPPPTYESAPPPTESAPPPAPPPMDSGLPH